jgi:hypothetical protein
MPGNEETDMIFPATRRTGWPAGARMAVDLIDTAVTGPAATPVTAPAGTAGAGAAGATDGLRPGRYVVMRVTGIDTGSAAAALPLLLAPFFPRSPARTARTQADPRRAGALLRLLERSGGRAHIAHARTRAVITIYLPERLAGSGLVARDDRLSGTTARGAGTGAAHAPGHPAAGRVVWVDDEPPVT